jgi:hypothetical protein
MTSIAYIVFVDRRMTTRPVGWTSHACHYFTICKRPSPGKVPRGTRAALTGILETLPEIQAELREQRRLLEILTACQTPDGAQQRERGSRR